MKRYLLLLVMFAMLVGSCANYKEIEITDVDVENVKLGPKTSLDVNVEVNNPTGKTFTIQSFNTAIMKDGVELAYVEMVGEAVVPRKAVTSVPMKLEIKFLNPLEALSMGLKFKSLDINQFTITPVATIKAGSFKPKKFILKNVPLKELEKYLK